MTGFKKLDDKVSKIYRLEKIARTNLKNTIRLLWHNIAEGIKLYRFSSQLIPLANHPEGQIWDYTEILKEQLQKIGNIVKKHNLKVSSHPGQYTVINTNNADKFKNAVRDLVYHDQVLTAMGLDQNTVMVTHAPKVHFSSPRSKKQPLHHADYIDADKFLEFVSMAENYNFDIMIEAKKQDAAILKLWEEIGYTPGK